VPLASVIEPRLGATKGEFELQRLGGESLASSGQKVALGADLRGEVVDGEPKIHDLFRLDTGLTSSG